MARAGVTFNGLDTFMDELRVMQAGLSEQAGEILVAAAESARSDIAAAYPNNSGALRRGMIIRPSRGITLVGAELVQTAPHGLFYDRGTVRRETKQHWNRGVMPAHPTFEPIAKRYRSQAIADIVDLLYQHGASRVTGEAA